MLAPVGGMTERLLGENSDDNDARARAEQEPATLSDIAPAPRHSESSESSGASKRVLSHTLPHLLTSSPVFVCAKKSLKGGVSTPPSHPLHPTYATLSR